MINVGLNGRIYAKASGVTKHNDNLIADFRGGVTANPTPTYVDWFGQYATRQDITMIQFDCPITINDVAFKPASFETIWGAAKNAADTLKDGLSTPATSYTFSSSTVTTAMEWLIICDLGGKEHEIYCKGVVEGSPINYSNRDYVVHSITITPYEASFELVKFLLEN